MDKQEMTLDWGREQIFEIVYQLEKRLFGVRMPIIRVLIGFLSSIPYSQGGHKVLGRGHVLLKAAPGFGKTDMMQGIAHTISTKYSFMVGQPETKISELVGADEYEVGSGRYFFRRGRVFTNILLYDEINRTHPKAQAALLQAMEERFIPVGVHNTETGEIEEKIFPLFPISKEADEKRMMFWVVASGNPFEQEGTYPIPEAQLDRFAVCLDIDLPSEENEEKIRLENVYAKEGGPQIETVMDPATFLDIAQMVVERVKFGKENGQYMGRIIHNSRPRPKRRRYAKKSLLDRIDAYVKAGLSPRANFHFQAVSRTIAFMNGKDFVSVDDIKEAARLVMPHRILLEPKARGKVKQHDLVEEILENTETPPWTSR